MTSSTRLGSVQWDSPGMTATDQFTHGPREARTPVARTRVLPLAAAGSIASSPLDHVLVLIRASKLHNWLKNRGIQKPRIVEPMAGTKRGRGRVL